MEWVKTTAKTLPEAIDLALDNLGVDESDAEIVVLEEPRTGLFGRVKGTARVEARVKPKQSRPKQERRKTSGRNKPRNDKGERSGRNGGGGRNKPRNKSQDNDQGRGQQGQNSKAQNVAASAGAASVAASGATTDQNKESASDNENSGRSNGRGDGNNRDQNGGRSRGGRNRGGNNGGSGGRKKRNSENNPRSENRTDSGPKVETPVEDVKNHLEEFLTGLTGAFGFEGPVTVDESPEDGLTGQIAGQHGLMVGPKGRTLDAIQDLARVSSSRKVPSSVRIKVDVGGYRAQRAVALGQFAVKAADNAVENGVEVALDPMSAADRKAIHDALSEDSRVETRSVGTDPRRKVLVVPVDSAPDESNEDGELVESSE